MIAIYMWSYENDTHVWSYENQTHVWYIFSCLVIRDRLLLLSPKWFLYAFCQNNQVSSPSYYIFGFYYVIFFLFIFN